MQPAHSRAFVTLMVGALAGLSVASAESQTVTVERLSDRVLVANTPPLGRNNVTAIATRKGLVLIDAAATPFIAGQIQRELEKQLGRSDWAYVFNTHVHDHTGGNVLFRQVPIVGHENTVEETKRLAELMTSEERKAPSLRFARGKIEDVQKKLDGGAADTVALQAELAFWRGAEDDMVKGFEVVAPTVRLTDELTLDMGDVTIRAVHPGRGHSPSDVVIHVPEERLLVAGSACGPFFPTIGDTVGLADLERSIAVLDRLLEAGVERVVPSHGEVGGREIAERRRDYQRDLVAGVRAARQQGLTLEQAQQTLGLDRFPYMREAPVFQGTREEKQAANVAAVWKLAP